MATGSTCVTVFYSYYYLVNQGLHCPGWNSQSGLLITHMEVIEYGFVCMVHHDRRHLVIFIDK